MEAVSTGPAGPATAHSAGLDSLRRQRGDLMWAAALIAIPALMLTALAWSGHAAWAVVDRNGVLVPAEVVGRSTGRSADRIQVAFATGDGQLVEASIPVDNVESYHHGSTVIVAYDPQNPRRVRTLDDWSPSYEGFAIIAGVLAVVVAGILWRAWRWPRRLGRLARSGAPRRELTLTGVTFVGRGPEHWGILGDEERPLFAFRLADAGDVDPVPTPVTVAGGLRRRGVVVVFLPDRVIWPAGRLHRPPKRALAALSRPPGDDRVAVGRRRRREEGLVVPSAFSPPSRRGSRSVGLAVILFSTVGLAAPLVLPDVIGARRQVCPQPPVSGPGLPGAIPSAELVELLPDTVAGFTATRYEVLELGSFANPPAQAAMVDAGFEIGVEREYRPGPTRLLVSVFQFGSERGPGRYEAARLSTLCPDLVRSLSLPDGTGVSAAVFATRETDRHRITFVRGSRDYVINVDGEGVSGEAEVLAVIAAVAR